MCPRDAALDLRFQLEGIFQQLFFSKSLTYFLIVLAKKGLELSERVHASPTQSYEKRRAHMKQRSSINDIVT